MQGWKGYQGHEVLQQMRLEEDLKKIEEMQQKTCTDKNNSVHLRCTKETKEG